MRKFNHFNTKTMRISKFIYSLGGADYNVIQHCTQYTKMRYLILGWTVILCTGLAIISAWIICRLFTPNYSICSPVALLWTTAIFSFDFFLIRLVKISVFTKYIFILLGICKSLITTVALLFSLNEKIIDSNHYSVFLAISFFVFISYIELQYKVMLIKSKTK